jgi:hypothetical protein
MSAFQVSSTKIVRLESQPLLDHSDPIRLALIELGDFSAGALDRSKVVGRQSALPLQHRRTKRIDFSECSGGRIAGSDRRGQCLLGRDPAVGLRPACCGSEAFSMCGNYVECGIAASRLVQQLCQSIDKRRCGGPVIDRSGDWQPRIGSFGSPRLERREGSAARCASAQKSE